MYFVSSVLIIAFCTMIVIANV